MMRHFLIVTNSTKDPDGEFTEMVCHFLHERGASYLQAGKAGGQADPLSPPEYSKSRSEPLQNIDCILVLGGDGTVLRAAGRYHSLGAPFLGINLGTLGYLAEIEKVGWKEALMQLLEGNYSIESRMMIEGRRSPAAKNRAGTSSDSPACGRTEAGRTGAGSEDDPGKDDPHEMLHTALNDIVIARSGALRIMNYDVRVNGQFLCTYNADGIIVSTPTGSTAYNLSAGGPVVEPGAKMIVLTPICPHQMNIRPIVLSADDIVEITIGSTSRGSVLEAEADFDGNDRVGLRTGDTITVRRSARTTRLVKLNNRSFLETLHKKMS